METFLEYETIRREPAPGHVFMESLAEIDPRKVAEVVRRSRHIRSLQYMVIRLDIGSLGTQEIRFGRKTSEITKFSILD